MKRLLLVLVLALAPVGVLAATSASADTTTIGQTSATGLASCGSWVMAPTVAVTANYTVPAGDWNVTSWSSQAGPGGGAMSMMVLRPAGGGTYTVVGESPVEALTANQLNTFTLADPIAVQPGDVLGLWASNTPTCMFSPSPYAGDQVKFVYLASQPGVDGSVAPAGLYDGYLLNISATLSTPPPSLPTLKDECKHGGWQSYGVFKNQGDCVSYIATGGKNPANGG